MTHWTGKLVKRCLPLAALATGLALGGCVTGGYDTFAYHEIHEIPEGPGLVTENGDYTIMARDLGAWGSENSSSASADVPAVTTSSGITEATTPE